MAALNFPSSPTVGQQYAGTNGITYTWDGETWTASGGTATGIAGGSLTGTYPNPTIALSGVTAAMYGTLYKVPQVTLNAEGRVTAVVEVTIKACWG